MLTKYNSEWKLAVIKMPTFHHWWHQLTIWQIISTTTFLGAHWFYGMFYIFLMLNYSAFYDDQRCLHIQQIRLYDVKAEFLHSAEIIWSCTSVMSLVLTHQYYFSTPKIGSFIKEDVLVLVGKMPENVSFLWQTPMIKVHLFLFAAIWPWLLYPSSISICMRLVPAN